MSCCLSLTEIGQLNCPPGVNSLVPGFGTCAGKCQQSFRHVVTGIYTFLVVIVRAEPLKFLIVCANKGAKVKPTMTALLEEIVRMLEEEQAQQETDMTRSEREVQAQMTTMQQHMESLLQVVNESTATVKLPHHTLDIKLVPLSVKDDTEAYIMTFERIMSAYKIWKDQWPYHLELQLTEKAQVVFTTLSSTEAKDYYYYYY